MKLNRTGYFYGLTPSSIEGRSPYRQWIDLRLVRVVALINFQGRTMIGKTILICVATLGMICSTRAGAILTNRITEVALQIEGMRTTPKFLFLFSDRPLVNAQRRPLTHLSLRNLPKSNSHHVAITVNGKATDEKGWVHYRFGPGKDVDMPWNNGARFDWQRWDRLSPDIWDALAIVCLSTDGVPGAAIRNVIVRRNGQLLLSTTERKTFSSGTPVDFSMRRFPVSPQGAVLPVLDLGGESKRFINTFYELDDHPVLTTAYSDLGQTGGRKYCPPGLPWCSEFASYVYLQNRITTPNPRRGNVGSGKFRAYFEKRGNVYSAREVASWTDQKKLTTIKPGSFVSMWISDHSHSVIFARWLPDKDGKVTSYAAISGNNQGMVMPLRGIKLPPVDGFAGKSREELAAYDQRAFFAVPQDLD